MVTMKNMMPNTAKKMSLITLGDLKQKESPNKQSCKSINTDHQLNNLLFTEIEQPIFNRNSQLDQQESMVRKRIKPLKKKR
jgi:hypothetical protein